jgi:glycosyltransferase involved in cell wall biosynthesis
LTKKQVKVLYVCPFAHYPGHPPEAAVSETRALAQAGAKVKLLTFCGIIGKAEVKVPQLTVLPYLRVTIPLYCLANFLRKWSYTRRLSMLLETCLTLAVAVRLKRKLNYDIIHLRDGDPFLFIPFLISLSLRDYNWVISLIGGSLAAPSPLLTALRKDFRLFVYIILLKLVNSNLWKPVYRRGLARNNFLFLTQNESIKQGFESYMQGVLSGKVTFLPLGVDEAGKVIPKKEARRYLGLPPERPVFLSFGFLHVGKDLETIFRALKDVPDALLLHGGDPGFSPELSSSNLAKKYGMLDRTVSRDCYIAEEEKPYYFFAADAIILSYTRQFSPTASLLWEACRFGTPVIASKNGQLKELVKASQVGFLFTAQDAGSLRTAIRQFLSLKPEEIRKLKANCRRFSGDFSLGKWAQRCLEIYDSLLMKNS